MGILRGPFIKNGFGAYMYFSFISKSSYEILNDVIEDPSVFRNFARFSNPTFLKKNAPILDNVVQKSQ